MEKPIAQQADEGIKTLEHGGVTWLDVQKPSARVFARLAERYQLSPVHLQESLQKVQHTEVDSEPDYLFLVLRLPVTEQHHGRIMTEQVGIFLGRGYLMTIHEGENAAVHELWTECNQPGGASENFGQGSAYLLYVLIARMLAAISVLTEQIMVKLDAIEDQVFENSASDAEDISNIRRQIVRLRRIIGPKKLLLDDLADKIDSFSGQRMARYYSDNLKSVNRLWEMLGEAKETIEIYKDADFTTSTEQTNKTLSVLTLIFTFTIPITVLGTVYGMNILLPGSVNGHPWTFWGTFTTLWLGLGVAVLVAVIMYALLKKKRWL